MNELIKKAINDGRVILFLGAGASIGSTNQKNETPPLGQELAKLIAEKAGWPYQNEPLGTVYSAAQKHIGPELDTILIEQYRNCKPSDSYETLASFPWARIYTTNIDDAFENALRKKSKQKINIKNRDDRVEDKDQLLSRLEYIYLNGTIKTPDTGFIFSPEEYGKASASQPKWYNEVASDFLQCVFIFIGTRLEEPVFFHQVERYKSRAGLKAPLSYIITPNATPIQASGFESYGLEYVRGTLSDFCKWLTSEFTTPPEPIDIAKNRIPELRTLLETDAKSDRTETIGLLSQVSIITRQSLNESSNKTNSGTIRQFYKGFKPTWTDILDGVPAEIEQLRKFSEKLNAAKDREKTLLALIGPAGSGKSTILKMAALKLSEEGHRIYFAIPNIGNLTKLIHELDISNKKPYFIFFERIDPIRNDIVDALKHTRHAIFVSAESQNIWHNRAESSFDKSKTIAHEIVEISEEDVIPILEKIRLFGPWTRLANMSATSRKKEIFEKSKRQLLIGLMEATTGVGFEQIIQRDYEAIASDSDKFLFVLTCIATLHRATLSQSMASRALSNAGIDEPPLLVSSRLKGIIDTTGDRLSARHPLYARKIIESVVDRELISQVIKSLLNCFIVYSHPVVKNLDKNDSNLFKSIINHKFLADVLRGSEDGIFDIYSKYEKYFESDGLFWLQYGLSKRSFGRNIEAFELLQTAYNAYPHDHTTHALAQQKMILASSGLLPSEQANSHLSDAINMLNRLDQTIESDDTYPIVTLAEGHISSLIALETDISARVKSKEYVALIDQRLRNTNDSRLKDCKTRLLKYATTGVWNDSIQFSK